MSLPLRDCFSCLLLSLVCYVFHFIRSKVVPDLACGFFFDSWEVFEGLLFNFEILGGFLDMFLPLISSLILIWQDNMLINVWRLGYGWPSECFMYT